jgi:hypothetical protein
MKLPFQALAAIGVSLLAQNSSQFRDWTDAALADNPHLAPKQACAAMASQPPTTSPSCRRRSSPRPATRRHCAGSGLIQPEIRFEVNLPAS